MYWKLNETPLGAFHFKHAHWKPSVFRIGASLQPLMGFHTSAFTTLSLVIQVDNFNWRNLFFVIEMQMMVVKQTYYSRMELSDDWTTEELTLAAHNIISKEGWR